MNPTNLIAIDPGTEGGFAYTIDGTPYAVPMPRSEAAVLGALRLARQHLRTCYLEKVGGYIPGAGGSTMFVFGDNFGYIKGCLDALDFDRRMVTPKQWQKALNLGGVEGPPKVPPLKKDATDAEKLAYHALVKETNRLRSAAKTLWKQKLFGEAQRIFPDLTITLAKSDALLILEYGRMQLSASTQAQPKPSKTSSTCKSRARTSRSNPGEPLLI